MKGSIMKKDETLDECYGSSLFSNVNFYNPEDNCNSLWTIKKRYALMNECVSFREIFFSSKSLQVAINNKNNWDFPEE